MSGKIGGCCERPQNINRAEMQAMLHVQYLAFAVVNVLAITTIPKLYAGSLALGFVNEVAAQKGCSTPLGIPFGKTEDRWGSDKFFSDCAGGCAALIGVISGLDVSKIQGFIVGAAFFASHIGHQAKILVPVTAFVAGQKLANYTSANTSKTCCSKPHSH